MHKHRRHCRGLATLELVLAIPILLFVMALMVNFGVVACWKVRSLNMARNALWSTRWPRTGAANSRPDFWPLNASANAGAAGNLPQSADPLSNQPAARVARGPLPGATVNAALLDPTRGLREGSASLTRGFAMLATLGSYHLQAQSTLLDDRWQYAEMGLGYNTDRRIPVLYAVQKASADLTAAYVQAVVAIFYAPFRQALSPLDNDAEFIYYGTLFGWGGVAPDFHPRLGGFCSLDRALADARVNELIDRIQGKKNPHISDVAESMARAFINLYQRAIQAYRNQPGAAPPPDLQQKIDALNQFLQTLQ